MLPIFILKNIAALCKIPGIKPKLSLCSNPLPVESQTDTSAREEQKIRPKKLNLFAYV